MEQLFVYGTLMRGEEREGLVAHLKAEAATVRGHLWKAPAGYPALLVNKDGARISGELLSIPDTSILQVLDLYEGVGQGLYDRILVEVESKNGASEAWTYVMNSAQLRRAGCTPIKRTDWRKLTRRL